MELEALVDRIPVGWTAVTYRGRRWGLRRADHAGGRTVTIEAEELSGSGRIGANVIRLAGGPVLRPCEIPERTVLDLLEGWHEGDARINGGAGPRRAPDLRVR